MSNERKQSNRYPLGVPVYPLQRRMEYSPPRQLTVLRYIHEGSKVFHEEAHSIRFELLLQKWTFRGEPCLNATERQKHLSPGEPMLEAHGSQYMGFDEIVERQRQWVSKRGFDQAPTSDPRTKRRRRKAQVSRRIRQRIRGEILWIYSSTHP